MGQPRRSGTTSARSPPNSLMALNRSMMTWPSRGASSMRIRRSDQLLMSVQRSSGKPSSLAVSRHGSWAARSGDHVHSPPRASMGSSRSAMTERNHSSWLRTARGVNRPETSRRWARCAGSSWAMMLFSSGDHHER